LLLTRTANLYYKHATTDDKQLQVILNKKFILLRKPIAESLIEQALQPPQHKPQHKRPYIKNPPIRIACVLSIYTHKLTSDNPSGKNTYKA
jgi:hypothetical protein